MAKYLDEIGLLTLWAKIRTQISNSFAANDAMVFKGTLGTGGTVTTLPTTQFSAGQTYKVITAGTYAGLSAHVGDLVICIKDNNTTTAVTPTNTHWTVVHANESGTVTGSSLTANNVIVGNGGSGVKASSYTISKSVPSNAVFTDTHTTKEGHYDPLNGQNVTITESGSTLGFGSAVITGITLDEREHVTGVTTSKLPSNPNTNTTYKTIVGNSASSTTNAAAGSPVVTYLNLVDSNNAVKGTTQFVAGDGVSISHDNTGKITITNSKPNTDTKVTSVGNHYSPTADINSALSVDASSTTAATWNTTSLVTGVNIARDAKGHVTGLTVDSIKMPANPNSNTAHGHAVGIGLTGSGNAGTNTGNYTISLNLVDGSKLSDSYIESSITFASDNSTFSANGKYAKVAVGSNNKLVTVIPTLTIEEIDNICSD